MRREIIPLSPCASIVWEKHDASPFAISGIEHILCLCASVGCKICLSGVV